MSRNGPPAARQGGRLGCQYDMAHCRRRRRVPAASPVALPLRPMPLTAPARAAAPHSRRPGSTLRFIGAVTLALVLLTLLILSPGLFPPAGDRLRLGIDCPSGC